MQLHVPALLALGVLGAPTVAQSAGVDPFAAGLRWTHAADPLAPWIPRDVCFVAAGELVWSAPAVGTPSLALLASAPTTDPDAALHRDGLSVADAIGAVRVAAGPGADALYSLVQLPAPTSATRRSLVQRHDAARAAGGAIFAPLWSTDLGPLGNGPALLAVDRGGDSLVACVRDPERDRLQLDWLDPVTGASARRVLVEGGLPRELALAADGSAVALLAGAELVVLDDGGGELLRAALVASTAALAISADGAVVAAGDLDRVRVYHPGTGASGPAAELLGEPGELPVAAALADDGGTLAVAWWQAAAGDGVRLEVFDLFSGDVFFEYVQSGTVGGLQNFPSGLRLTPDGRRVALGLWGAGDERPEILLFEPRAPADEQELLAVDLPGSVEALDLDASGTRLVVAQKHAHANLFSTTGELGLYDTGERDLQLVEAVRPGGTVTLSYRLFEPGQAIFAAGTPLVTPIQLPPALGELWIDLAGDFQLFAGVPDGLDRACLEVRLRPEPSLIGVPLAVQAATLGPTGIALSGVVRPVVL